MIFRITVYRHGANPIMMPHGHQAVTVAGAVNVWAKMPARSVVTSQVCPEGAGRFCVQPLHSLCVTLSSVVSSLPAGSRGLEHPEPKRGGFGFTLPSLKDRVWKEWNQRSENGHLPKLRICDHEQDHSNDPDVSVWFRALLPRGCVKFCG